eukprot:CAMPEP_0114523484 /NCGR_PEP_ID=MMETSP0109-20121206/21315_1 /TAXON_ID=29199 /ORGANISM="Chlorarachnion reptans, Strain CCCM449" /LENGTH=337 /DNA_ID=CAMNT_0001704801 /DNA_START=297 /DNA_END=1310 /DNA_ORIENTATION=-
MKHPRCKDTTQTRKTPRKKHRSSLGVVNTLRTSNISTLKRTTPRKNYGRKVKAQKDNPLRIMEATNLDGVLGGIGHDLATAANGDPSKDFFRKALLEGLKGAQAVSLGSARLHSALAGSYGFEEMKVQRLSDGLPSRIRVSFVDISNKKYNETVDLFPIPVLKAVLRKVVENGGTDFLRPYHMAQCSPRMFWSLIKAFGKDIHATLKELMPDIDWKRLGARKRTKSKKAIENQRQQLETGECTKRETKFKNPCSTPSKKSSANISVSKDRNGNEEEKGRNPAKEVTIEEETQSSNTRKNECNTEGKKRAEVRKKRIARFRPCLNSLSGVVRSFPGHK